MNLNSENSDNDHNFNYDNNFNEMQKKSMKTMERIQQQVENMFPQPESYKITLPSFQTLIKDLTIFHKTLETVANGLQGVNNKVDDIEEVLAQYILTKEMKSVGIRSATHIIEPLWDTQLMRAFKNEKCIGKIPEKDDHLASLVKRMLEYTRPMLESTEQEAKASQRAYPGSGFSAAVFGVTGAKKASQQKDEFIMRLALKFMGIFPIFFGKNKSCGETLGGDEYLDGHQEIIELFSSDTFIQENIWAYLSKHVFHNGSKEIRMIIEQGCEAIQTENNHPPLFSKSEKENMLRETNYLLIFQLLKKRIEHIHKSGNQHLCNLYNLLKSEYDQFVLEIFSFSLRYHWGEPPEIWGDMNEDTWERTRGGIQDLVKMIETLTTPFSTKDTQIMMRALVYKHLDYTANILGEYIKKGVPLQELYTHAETLAQDMYAWQTPVMEAITIQEERQCDLSDLIQKSCMRIARINLFFIFGGLAPSSIINSQQLKDYQKAYINSSFSSTDYFQKMEQWENFFQDHDNIHYFPNYLIPQTETGNNPGNSQGERKNITGKTEEYANKCTKKFVQENKQEINQIIKLLLDEKGEVGKDCQTWDNLYGRCYDLLIENFQSQEDSILKDMLSSQKMETYNTSYKIYDVYKRITGYAIHIFFQENSDALNQFLKRTYAYYKQENLIIRYPFLMWSILMVIRSPHLILQLWKEIYMTEKCNKHNVSYGFYATEWKRFFFHNQDWEKDGVIPYFRNPQNNSTRSNLISMGPYLPSFSTCEKMGEKYKHKLVVQSIPYARYLLEGSVESYQQNFPQETEKNIFLLVLEERGYTLLHKIEIHLERLIPNNKKDEIHILAYTIYLNTLVEYVQQQKKFSMNEVYAHALKTSANSKTSLSRVNSGNPRILWRIGYLGEKDIKTIREVVQTYGKQMDQIIFKRNYLFYDIWKKGLYGNNLHQLAQKIQTYLKITVPETGIQESPWFPWIQQAFIVLMQRSEEKQGNEFMINYIVPFVTKNKKLDLVIMPNGQKPEKIDEWPPFNTFVQNYIDIYHRSLGLVSNDPFLGLIHTEIKGQKDRAGRINGTLREEQCKQIIEGVFRKWCKYIITYVFVYYYIPKQLEQHAHIPSGVNNEVS